MFAPIVGWDRCPYGKVVVQDGPTPRSKQYRKWIKGRTAEGDGVPQLGSPGKKIYFVGDYVYLPYAFMNMNENVPFLRHGSIFVSGTSLISRSAWTLETVLNIIDFRPHALMGGEITDYQECELPKFLQHLREVDPEMWGALVAERPKFDVAPDYVGRRALLRTLVPPFEWGTMHNKYPVSWKWDGKQLSTSDKNAYEATWGGIRLKSFKLCGEPEENASIVVRDNGWVDENTIFLD